MLDGAFEPLATRGPKLAPPELGAEDRRDARCHLRADQQRRVPERLSPPPRRRTRRRAGSSSPRSTAARGRSGKQRYLCGETLTLADHRALHHAPAVRPRLLRALQVQPAAHPGLPEPVGLPARDLPAAGGAGDVPPRRDQDALLLEPEQREPGPASCRSGRRSIWTDRTGAEGRHVRGAVRAGRVRRAATSEGAAGDTGEARRPPLSHRPAPPSAPSAPVLSGPALR